MIRNKKQCNKCKRFISLSNFNRHYNSCNNKSKSTVNSDWLQPDGKYKCPYCQKTFVKMGIMIHIWSKHTEEGKNFKPGKNKTPWNKGLTKHTDERVKKGADTFLINIKSGKNVPWWKGRKHTKESKRKISESRIKYLQENPDKVPYLINHSSKMSYPEQILYNALINSNIEGWIYKYQNSIYEYDFAFPQLKIDIEVDGETHNTEKVKKIDKRRDAFSKKEGWKVLRFKSNDIKNNTEHCLNIIKNTINTINPQA